MKVLILGGGVAGVTAAWELSRTPERRDRFDVTLVQAGWRLGGKGATGRDPQYGHGVLEHGLHIWLGFYRRAFEMMADLYGSWSGRGPQRSISDAFSPMRATTLVGPHERWELEFPETPGRPWDGDGVGVAWTALARGWSSLIPGLSRHPKAVAGMLGLGRVVAKGLAREFSQWGRHAWDKMNELDLRQWLRNAGADSRVVNCPAITALYDLGFAYPTGDPRAGSAAAGVALRILLRIFGEYRGAPFWRMNAGMGDTVFVPAWHVLRQRGVDIQLFHHVQDIELRDGRVDAVRLGVQARFARYDPLVRVGDVEAWPSAPRFEQLDSVVDGSLEGDRSLALEESVRRCGRDFDAVVLAIPSTAHRGFARALMNANPRYERMVRSTCAVPTIAAQWWFDRAPSALGMREQIVTGCEGGVRTWADLSPVVGWEGWRSEPCALAYGCAVAPPEVMEAPSRQLAFERARTTIHQWERDVASRYWPAARSLRGGFDEGALRARYVRVNFERWERYVLSQPGTIRYRLGPTESGFDNLLLAGDWTRNEINGGSVEAAALSAVEAAQAIVSMP